MRGSHDGNKPIGVSDPSRLYVVIDDPKARDDDISLYTDTKAMMIALAVNPKPLWYDYALPYSA
jgi:hypothetical protein